MHVSRDGGIVKVVGVAIAFSTKVKKGLGVLMHKQRRKRADVTQTIVLKNGSASMRPRLRACERMRGRSHCRADTSSSIRCSSPNE